MSLAFFATNSEENLQGTSPYPAPDIIWDTREWERMGGGAYEREERQEQAVSQENVEVVRRTFDAFNRRDLDGILHDYDPEAELDWSQSPGVEAGIYRGREAIREFWSTFFETWERIIVYADEPIDCGKSVVAPTRTHFWGRSGIEVEAYGVFVVTLREGRIVVWRLFRELNEALKAVGLKE
jgi:ketosteroid isomerase-like protein